jgi:signal peptidase II
VPERNGAPAQVKFFLIALAAVANLVLADAVVKELAAGLLRGNPPVAVIPGFFDLAYVENRGCAWGMLQGQVWPLAVFGIAALVFLIWKRRSVFGDGGIARLSEILLYAGIVGNLIDRVCRGYVIDMFDFYWKTSHFPCFNLADAYISIAAGIMILCSFGKRTS